MLSIISPAKSLDFSSIVPINTATEAEFATYTDKLLKILKLLSSEQLQQIMKISNKIADLNQQRFASFLELQQRQAIFAYDGDVYKNIDKKSIIYEKVDFLQLHISIISGLYGILRPLDCIRPYRLEMSVRLPNIDLYDFWQEAVTTHINEVLFKHKTQYLVNLSSIEYAKIINKNLLNYPMINIHFKEYYNQKLRVIGVSSKKARGLMINYIIKNSIDRPEDLKSFSENGYIFDDINSSKHDWVFIRNFKISN